MMRQITEGKDWHNFCVDTYSFEAWEYDEEPNAVSTCELFNWRGLHDAHVRRYEWIKWETEEKGL
jgi:hypothetical protein